MKPTTLLWCATAVAACANVATPSTAAADRLAEARSLLAGDPHRALAITDELLRQAPDWTAARLCAAEGSLRLAAEDRTGHRNAFLQDAERHLQRVADRSGADGEPLAWQQLAACRLELGDDAGALLAADEAARRFAVQRTSRADVVTAQQFGARAAYRLFAAARLQELADAGAGAPAATPASRATLELATRAAARWEALAADHPGEAFPMLAMVRRWLGQDAEELAALERGVRTAPPATEIHDALIEFHAARGQFDALVGGYRRLGREQPATPVLRWHLGRATYRRADHLRSQGNFAGAAQGYADARQVFGEYAAMVPAHAATAGQWLALCDLAGARVAVELGDLATAQERLFAAAAASPLCASYVDGQPQLVDGFGGHYAGVVFAIHRALSESGADALARTLAFNEAVLARQPDQFGFVYNNAALAARDLGVQVARAQGERAAAAVELWERSYRYYEKAVQLSPDDPRIVNDCGLMLIYHLHRDLDRAEALFRRAIELGGAQLAALPADADPADRERLEEAVGDAWQNLAVLARDHRQQPFAAYREFCTQAVRYFPYQRREAAALLRTQGQGELSSAQRAAAAADAAAQGGAAEALAKVRAEVEQKAAAEDYDGALAILDKLAKDCRQHAPYHALRGELTWKLAVQGRDANRKGFDLLFQDAVTALQKAVELDAEPVGPRRHLAQALYDTGELAKATATASALLLHMQSQGGGKPEDLLAVHGIRANAAARAFAGAKQEGKDQPELLADARTSLRFLEQQGQLDKALRDLWSATELWAGAPAEAVNVHVRALQKNPDDQAALAAVVDTAAAQNQLPLAIEALQQRSDATGLWYLGRARYLLADALRGSKMKEAIAALDQAQKDFEQSMQKNADYRDSCEQWVAMCLGKKGNLAFRSDDLANAATWLLESARRRPDRIAEDLGLAESTKLGIMLVADKHFRGGDLGRAEAIFRAAAEAANGDLDLLNNAGLFARDHGNALERDGKAAEAKQLYEHSYKAYRRAQQLDPASVRLRNDCALMAIYHLDRDWELAKELLDTAIADGEKQLRDNPPAEPQEQRNLEEAVGDCYENLALWHLKHSKDAAAAKAAAQKSQDFHPGKGRPGARRHLAAAERMLQGK